MTSAIETEAAPAPRAPDIPVRTPSPRERWQSLDRRARIATLLFVPVVLYLLTYLVIPGTSDFLADKAPHEPVVVGIIVGTVNALLAIGLILIYRTNRFVNFAYGATGSLVGFTAIVFHVDKGVPFFVVLPLAVVAGVLVGALLEIGVIRRFQNSSRLVVTVASIGLAQVLGGIERGIVNEGLSFAGFVGGFRSPIDVQIDIGDKILGGDEILIVAVVPLVIAGLAWFLLRTDAGVAVRAAAENQDRALLLGIPVKRLSTIVWGLSGGLAALTFVLKAPFSGAALSLASGPTVLLPALAAAVVARMESLPIAFAAGISLGIAEQLVAWNSGGTPSFTNVVFLVVILGALLLQRKSLSRAKLGEDGGWTSAGVVKPTPRQLRHLPEVRYPRYALAAVVLFLFVWLPSTFGPSSQLLATFAVIMAIAGVSLVVLTGWGGHISLGQYGLLGVGAVVGGTLVEARVDYFIAIAVAGATGALVALVVGLPALRIRGLFLAITTLAFAVALDSWLLNPQNFPQLIPVLERNARPVLWERFDLTDNLTLYRLSLAMLGLACLAAIGVRKARSGRVVIATRDNERAADAAAVPTTSVKLSAFLLAGTLAGAAGALHVVAISNIGVGTYAPSLSIEAFTTTVIGGLGSLTGAISGVLLFQFLGTVQALGEYRIAVTGAGLLVVLYALPGGIGGVLFGLRDRYLRRVADRRGIIVPSLNADKRDDDSATGAADESGLLLGALQAPEPVPVPNGSTPNGSVPERETVGATR